MSSLKNPIVSLLILPVIFGLFIVSNVTAQALDDSMRAFIHNGIEKTINNEFSNAETHFRSLIDRYPEHPVGYFYVGATIQAEILDREDYARLPEFEIMMERAINLAEASDTADAWVRFLEGSAYLYKSFVDSKRGSMWSAYRNASKGTNRLEKALALDSTFYDAYMGVGSYKYWKSSKTKGINWLPFVADDREKGIHMVQRSIEKGEFVHSFGKDQLAWIFIDSKRIAEAESLALANHRRYPESRFFMWTLVEIYFRSEQFDEAYQLYNKLLTIVRQMPQNNHYNESDCLLKLAEIDCQRGEFMEAERHIEALLAIDFSEDIRKRVEKRLKRARELRLHCRQQLAAVNKK